MQPGGEVIDVVDVQGWLVVQWSGVLALAGEHRSQLPLQIAAVLASQSWRIDHAAQVASVTAAAGGSGGDSGAPFDPHGGCWRLTRRRPVAARQFGGDGVQGCVIHAGRHCRHREAVAVTFAKMGQLAGEIGLLLSFDHWRLVIGRTATAVAIQTVGIQVGHACRERHRETGEDSKQDEGTAHAQKKTGDSVEGAHSVQPRVKPCHVGTRRRRGGRQAAGDRVRCLVFVRRDRRMQTRRTDSASNRLRTLVPKEHFMSLQTHIGTRAVGVAVLTLVALVGAGTSTLASDSTNRVNGSVTIDAGQTHGDARTVNGSVTLGANARAGRVESVNGGIRLDTGAHASSLEAVNGAIRLAEDAVIEGDVTGVNGAITALPGVRIEGDLGNVNGTITLDRAQVGGQLSSTNGSMLIGTGTVIEGGLLMRKPGGRQSDDRRPRVVIGPGAQVHGALTFERDVHLYVHQSAQIGTVTGASAVRFSGSEPPATD